MFSKSIPADIISLMQVSGCVGMVVVSGVGGISGVWGGVVNDGVQGGGKHGVGCVAVSFQFCV